MTPKTSHNTDLVTFCNFSIERINWTWKIQTSIAPLQMVAKQWKSYACG
jgi:hypothetical protein